MIGQLNEEVRELQENNEQTLVEQNNAHRQELLEAEQKRMHDFRGFQDISAVKNNRIDELERRVGVLELEVETLKVENNEMKAAKQVQDKRIDKLEHQNKLMMTAILKIQNEYDRNKKNVAKLTGARLSAMSDNSQQIINQNTFARMIDAQNEAEK